MNIVDQGFCGQFIDSVHVENKTATIACSFYESPENDRYLTKVEIDLSLNDVKLIINALGYDCIKKEASK